jgi:aspartate dehydrogenase
MSFNLLNSGRRNHCECFVSGCELRTIIEAVYDEVRRSVCQPTTGTVKCNGRFGEPINSQEGHNAVGCRVTRRIGVVGNGAIGSVVARELANGLVDGASLECVVVRSACTDLLAPAVPLDEALGRCDLIVEAAGHQFVCDHGERILGAGPDLLVASIGALADEILYARLLAARPGRLFLTAGALGGLDLISAARRLAPFEKVELITTKLPKTLIQPWMTAREKQRLAAATSPIDVHRGSAREVARLFPKSANVAAALALAARTWEVQVLLRADPMATATSHRISAKHPFGSYHFEIENAPDAANPATSMVVPFAILRGIATVAGERGQIV